MKKKVASTHHIIPSSKGGPTTKENLSNITRSKHELYHQLFDNMTPVEILKFLSSYFWKNQEKKDGDRFIAEYYQTVIFAKYIDEDDGRTKRKRIAR